MDFPKNTHTHTHSHLAVPHPSSTFLFLGDLSCFCHFLNNLIAHCFMEKRKTQPWQCHFLWKLCVRTVSFLFKVIQSMLRQSERLVRCNPLWLSPTLSPRIPFTCLHTSHLLFPYQSPIYQTGRGAGASGGSG